MPEFESGSLWSRVVSQTERATQLGKIQRIPTRDEILEQDGVRFVVRIVDAVERKRIARLMQPSHENPFLPYDEDLFVTNVTDTHICLLNKFNVVEHHLLIVTRLFEHQETLLTERDFEAMWICLREFDSLAFYNAGTVAGASQPHKHLQQVSAPLGAGPERTPMDAVFGGTAVAGQFGSVAELPFSHLLAPLRDVAALEPHEAATATTELYLAMLDAIHGDAATSPYNLLATRDWMLLVPRSAEKYESISVNSLGFAGSLLVRDEAELSVVRAAGPMTILREVAKPIPD
jgi:ATP adenylyltransferase